MTFLLIHHTIFSRRYMMCVCAPVADMTHRIVKFSTRFVSNIVYIFHISSRNGIFSMLWLEHWRRHISYFFKRKKKQQQQIPSSSYIALFFMVNCIRAVNFGDSYLTHILFISMDVCVIVRNLMNRINFPVLPNI